MDNWIGGMLDEVEQAEKSNRAGIQIYVLGGPWGGMRFANGVCTEVSAKYESSDSCWYGKVSILIIINMLYGVLAKQQTDPKVFMGNYEHRKAEKISITPDEELLTPNFTSNIFVV